LQRSEIIMKLIMVLKSNFLLSFLRLIAPTVAQILIFAATIQLINLHQSQARGSLDKENSAFLLITHKGGYFSGLGHNHIISAKKYEIKYSPTSKIEQTRFKFSATIFDMVFDDPAVKERWIKTILSMAIFKKKPDDVSDSDRKKIRNKAFSKEQINITKYSKIEGKVIGITKKRTNNGRRVLTHQLEVEVKLHGKTIKRMCAGDLRNKDGKYMAEVVCEFKFTEFGITPLSMFFGAVKNKDKFHILVAINIPK